MKIDEIKTIVKLMSDNDLTEFKIESEEMTLCLRRAARQQAAPACIAQIAGLGADGYEFALRALVRRLSAASGQNR